MFKNWKTTLSGLLAALPFVLKFFGINLPQEISDVCTGTGLAGMGYYSKDKNVTGGTTQQ